MKSRRRGWCVPSVPALEEPRSGSITGVAQDPHSPDSRWQKMDEVWRCGATGGESRIPAAPPPAQHNQQEARGRGQNKTPQHYRTQNALQEAPPRRHQKMGNFNRAGRRVRCQGDGADVWTDRRQVRLSSALVGGVGGAFRHASEADGEWRGGPGGAGPGGPGGEGPAGRFQCGTPVKEVRFPRNRQVEFGKPQTGPAWSVST